MKRHMQGLEASSVPRDGVLPHPPTCCPPPSVSVIARYLCENTAQQEHSFKLWCMEFLSGCCYVDVLTWIMWHQLSSMWENTVSSFFLFPINHHSSNDRCGLSGIGTMCLHLSDLYKQCRSPLCPPYFITRCYQVWCREPTTNNKRKRPPEKSLQNTPVIVNRGQL